MTMDSNDLIHSKDEILDKISQEEIFAYYIGGGVTVDIIRKCLQEPSFQIRNPLRKDRNPTVGFKYVNSKGKHKKLRMKDFSGFFWGDCFDLVASIYGKDTKNKQDFLDVLEIICVDFGLTKNTQLPYRAKEESLIFNNNNNYFLSQKSKTKIDITTRAWNNRDAVFWKGIYVTRQQLEIGEVYPCYHIFINGKLIYQYFNDNDIAYCYNFGNLNNEIANDVQIYFPYRQKGRKFLMNFSKMMVGINGEIKENGRENLLITKSRKDVLCLKSLLQEVCIDIDVISVPSETYLMTDEEFNKYWLLYDNIFTLFDFDFTGRNLAWKYKITYGINSLFLTNGRINTINYGSKDFSDFVRTNRKEKAVNLIINTYEYLKNKRNRTIKICTNDRGNDRK